jgi:hypothetical protein
VRSKLAFLILVIGLTACGLLALRQQRLRVVHDLAVVHKNMARMDQDLLRVRVDIAQAITPQRVVQLAGNLGPMRPLGVDPEMLPARPASDTAIVVVPPAPEE